MDKKTKTVLAIIVVAGVMVAGYYYALRANKARAPKQEPYMPPVVEKVNTSITENVGKTNPFDVRVSPYDGYKNPFAQ